MCGWPATETVFWALVGGTLAEFLTVFDLRDKVANDLPYWFRSGFYWISVAGMVAAGGVIALAYVRSGFALNAILAINVGASAPLLLRQAVAGSPRPGSSPPPDRIN